jgi:hypothetical protein
MYSSSGAISSSPKRVFSATCSTSAATDSSDSAGRDSASAVSRAVSSDTNSSMASRRSSCCDWKW